MAMITYPLNNVQYQAEDAELYNSSRTSGVYGGNDFSWSLTGEDNTITVGKGLAWIKNSEFSGKVVAHKDFESFDFGVAPTAKGRMDVLAIQFDSTKNATDLVIKKGVEDDSYSIPEINQTVGTYELYLFAVKRKPGAGYITAKDITDLRDNRDYCGYMSDGVREGYAPSLMEHNKGNDFRFWVGTEAEYLEQKEMLPPNTFCVTTDGTTKDDVFGAIKTKAPNGYGLGYAELKEWNDRDNITQPGWYRFGSSSGNIIIAGISYSYVYMRVDSYNEKQATQTIYPIDSSQEQAVFIRSKQGDKWSGIRKILTMTEYHQLKKQIEDDMSGYVEAIYDSIDALEKKIPEAKNKAVEKKWSERDKITDPGWYLFKGGISVKGISADYAFMRVDSYNDIHAVQVLYLISGTNDYEYRRRRYSTGWASWERVSHTPTIINSGSGGNSGGVTLPSDFGGYLNGKTIHNDSYVIEDPLNDAIFTFSNGNRKVVNYTAFAKISIPFGESGIYERVVSLPYKWYGYNGVTSVQKELRGAVVKYSEEEGQDNNNRFDFVASEGVTVHRLEIYYSYLEV